MNKVIAMGNLTRDPELRFTPSGKAVCNVGLALNHSWKTESGEKKEEVTFIDCVCWGVTAENVARYCKKGKKVLIEARLQQQLWEDKQTHEKRSKHVLQVETIQFLGSKDDAGSAPSASPRPAPGYTQPGYQPQGAAAPAQQQEANPGPEDDIPF